MDCREFDATNLNFDLIFTDPPFNLELTKDFQDVIFNNCNGHAFVMHNERHLARLIYENNDSFVRMYAVDTVIPMCISTKAPMTQSDFIAEFRFSKTKFKNRNTGFSTMIKSPKKRMLKSISANFDKAIFLPGIFIEHFTDKKEIIFDPFAGSCSTLIAAKRLGRKSIGIEKNKDVCKKAIEYLSQIEIDFFDKEPIYQNKIESYNLF